MDATFLPEMQSQFHESIMASEFVVNPIFEYIRESGDNLDPKDHQRAEVIIDNVRPKIWQNNKYESISLWRTPLKVLQSFGHGLYFYFFALKYFAIVFAVLTLICLPPIILNLKGNGLTEFKYIRFWLLTTAVNSPILLTQSVNSSITLVNVSQVLFDSNLTIDDRSHIPDKYFPSLELQASSNSIPNKVLNGTEFIGNNQSPVTIPTLDSSIFNTGSFSSEFIVYIQNVKLTSNYAFAKPSSVNYPEGCAVTLSTFKDSNCSGLFTNLSISNTQVLDSQIIEADIEGSFINKADFASGLLVDSKLSQSTALFSRFTQSSIDNSYTENTRASDLYSNHSDIRDSDLNNSNITDSRSKGSMIITTSIKSAVVFQTNLDKIRSRRFPNRYWYSHSCFHDNQFKSFTLNFVQCDR